MHAKMLMHLLRNKYKTLENEHMILQQLRGAFWFQWKSWFFFKSKTVNTNNLMTAYIIFHASSFVWLP